MSMWDQETIKGERYQLYAYEGNGIELMATL